MKITYYQTHYNGYSIFAEFIDTDDPCYISHDDHCVMMRIPARDLDGYVKDDEFDMVSYWRNFADQKNATLAALREQRASLDNIIAELENETSARNEHHNSVST